MRSRKKEKGLKKAKTTRKNKNRDGRKKGKKKIMSKTFTPSTDQRNMKTLENHLLEGREKKEAGEERKTSSMTYEVTCACAV